MQKFTAVFFSLLAIGLAATATVEGCKCNDTYKVSVICELQKAVEAGKYDRVNVSILGYHTSSSLEGIRVVVDRFHIRDDEIEIPIDNFPETGCKTVQVEVGLVCFERKVTSIEAIAELNGRGLRPATLVELLALGEAQPDLQRQFFIVALGSKSYRGQVPILSDAGGRRILELNLFHGGTDHEQWGPATRFAAVRK